MEWPARLRLLQPNLRTVDVAALDADRLIDEIADCGANAVLLNGGGMVVWYPSALEFQRRPQGLAFDFVAAAMAAARRRDLVTLLRFDATKTYPEYRPAHPDWFRVGPDGGPLKVGPFFETCMNGPFWQQHAFEIMDELLSYGPDGIFLNSFIYRACESACAACDAALGSLAKRLGVARDDPLVRGTWMAEFVDRIADAVSSRLPGATVSFDMEVLTDDPRHRAAAGWSRLLWSQAKPVVAIAFNRLTRPQPVWQQQPGENARYLSAVVPDRAPLIHVTYSAVFGNRRAAQPPDQLAHDLIQAAANGGGVGVQLPGTLAQDDRRALPALRSIYRHLADHDAIYARARSASRIALVQSQITLERTLNDDPVGRHLEEYRGWYAALVEGHLPFDVIDDDVLASDGLERYRTIILPNVAVLDDERCEKIDAFVSAGGTVVATFETSLRRPDGTARPDFGLRSIGRSYARTLVAPGSYVRAAGDEVRAILGDTDLLGLGAESPYGGFGPLSFGEAVERSTGPVGEAELVVTASIAGVERALDLFWVPPVTNNIPEFSFVPAATAIPGLSRGDHGGGQIVYLSWLVGRALVRYAQSGLGALLTELVTRATPEPSPLEVDAPDSVEATLQQLDGGGWLVHLINANGLHGPERRVQPVGPVRVRVRGASHARALRADARVHEVDGWTVVERLERFEAFVFD